MLRKKWEQERKKITGSFFFPLSFKDPTDILQKLGHIKC